MKNFTTVKALALSLLCALPAVASAKHYEDREYYRDNDDYVGSTIRPCGWSLEVHGGIAPILWNKRDCFYLANCRGTNNSAQLTALGGLPKFRHLYRIPWDVGFRIGYGVCDNVEATLEFDYRQARARDCSNDCNDCCVTTTVTCCDTPFSLCYTTSNTSDGTNTFVFSNLSRYKSFNGHVGARWYTQRYWCDSVAFFLGIKVGFTHHKEIDVTVTHTHQVGSAAATVVGTPFTCTPLFFRNTTISAGGLVGFDYAFWNCLSFVVQAEFLGQGPLRANHNIGLSNCDNDCTNDCDNDCTTTCVNISATQTATTNLVGANFNTEIVFPVTFGLKYYF